MKQRQEKATLVWFPNLPGLRKATLPAGTNIRINIHLICLSEKIIHKCTVINQTTTKVPLKSMISLIARLKRESLMSSEFGKVD